MSKQDWAQDLIVKLESAGLADQDNATTAFCESYKSGDSVDAYNDFVKTATVHNFDDGQYFLAVFPDGSCYADWKQGIDRFYPDTTELISDNEDVAEDVAAVLK